MSVKSVLPLTQENDDLVKFLHDLKDRQLPEKEFLFGVLSTLMSDEVRMLLFEATKKRAPAKSEDYSNLIEISKEFAEQIDSLLSMKSKQQCLVYVDK